MRLSFIGIALVIILLAEATPSEARTGRRCGSKKGRRGSMRKCAPTRAPATPVSRPALPLPLPAQPSRSPTRFPTKSPTPVPAQNPTSSPMEEFPTLSPTSFCSTTQAHSNGHYYAVVLPESPPTWSQANSAASTYQCCSAQGHLATISDANENEFIRRFLNQTHPVFGEPVGWIGLTDGAGEGNFMWVQAEPLTYQNWRSESTNDDIDSREDYVAMYGSDGTWDDLMFDEPIVNAYVVEFDCPD